MSKSSIYEEKTEALILPIIEENNFELVDVEYVKEAGNWYLRAYIDKPGGITIDDCEKVSRLLSDLLDQNDFIDDSYILEVSSPGLGRQLKKEKDYIRSIGEDVDVKLYQAITLYENGKEVKVKEFTGTLKSYDNGTFVIAFDEEDEISIDKKDIAIIKLAIDF
ncbi:MAG: ribosome maturation factor RimP [Lachnospiraceae bacterium]|nr:ribosome maturation factor RimP [Lachnospiraceae bacterium]